MQFKLILSILFLSSFALITLASSSCSYNIIGCDACRSNKACDSCSAGYYKTGINTCSPCPKNKFSDAGATKCSYCTLTQWAPVGSKACSNCITGCDTCNDSETCNSCSAGYYLNLETNACDKCPQGTDSVSGSYNCS